MTKKDDPDRDDNQDSLFRKLMLNDKNFKLLSPNNKAKLTANKKNLSQNKLADKSLSYSHSEVPLSFNLSRPLVSAEDYISYFKVGLQNKTIKQLKNGDIKIEAVLDLHALTQEQACFEFSRFMTSCYKNNLHCICIIHGKGTRSNQAQPVLKNLVNNWLYEFVEIILGFCSCPPKHGGTGAVLVLFKST